MDSGLKRYELIQLERWRLDEVGTETWMTEEKEELDEEELNGHIGV